MTEVRIGDEWFVELSRQRGARIVADPDAPDGRRRVKRDEIAEVRTVGEAEVESMEAALAAIGDDAHGIGSPMLRDFRSTPGAVERERAIIALLAPRLLGPWHLHQLSTRGADFVASSINRSRVIHAGGEIELEVRGGRVYYELEESGERGVIALSKVIDYAEAHGSDEVRQQVRTEVIAGTYDFNRSSALAAQWWEHERPLTRDGQATLFGLSDLGL